ncbi:MAG: DNA polymerase III subunit beta [Nitrospirota bacterium]
MKLSVSKDEIQEKLSNIQNIVEKRNTMPVLSHFLLSAGKKGSHIVATDLETALKEPLQVNVEKEGRLCIPARKLFEIVREVDGDLSFESIDEQWLRVKAGNSEFRLACLSANEFPAWPGMEEVENIVVEVKTLMDMIEKTIYSAGESDTRYTLNGLLFHIKPEEGRLTIVGTDGHRLASIVRQMDGEDIKDEKKMIVPRKAASELRRFLDGEVDKVRISMGRNHILFSIGDVEFLTRLIEGTYPNYEQVIPVANEKKVSIGRDAFTKALRRVSIMSKERSNAIKFDLTENVIALSSSNPELGEARDEVAVDYKGDKLSVGFNARYLLDAIGVMTSERVILELQDPLSPVILREEGDEDYRCVIMPMRI